MTAPERIWAWKWNTPGIKANGKPSWSDFRPVFDEFRTRGWPTKEHWLGTPETHPQDATEYTRTDIHQAALDRIAELEGALEELAEAANDGYGYNWVQQTRIDTFKAAYSTARAVLAKGDG